MENLVFQKDKYVIKEAMYEGRCIKYRSFENIVYVSHPVD